MGHLHGASLYLPEMRHERNALRLWLAPGTVAQQAQVKNTALVIQVW
uniref:Uncharacterized protein n=1 Tax=Chenopodium quinoa TaxID=63459 RepID=A0A803M2C3_CHEQI